MGKFILVLICFLLPAAAALAGPLERDELRPAYIYVGSASDGGWSYTVDQGRLKADSSFPGVKSMVAESIMEGGETSLVIEQMIKRGKANLVIAASYGYGKYILAAAEKYPQVKFVHVSGDQRAADNVSTYFGRIYQARYLSGLVAGKMSKNNLIGYVAAFPIPEVVRGINAFTLGVQAVNPQARVKVQWLYSWYNQDKERELCNLLIGQGCDLIAMHADTGEVARACEAARVYVIGYNNDMSAYAPTMHLTAPVWHWGTLFAHAYQQVLEDRWQSEDLWWGLKEGVIGLAPFGPQVNDDVRRLVEEQRKRIIAGQLDVFSGPVKDNAGQLRIMENQSMSDAELLKFDWFVEGVEGDL